MAGGELSKIVVYKLPLDAPPTEDTPPGTEWRILGDPTRTVVFNPVLEPPPETDSPPSDDPKYFGGDSTKIAVFQLPLDAPPAHVPPSGEWRLDGVEEGIPQRPNRYFPRDISQADTEVILAEVYPPVAEALLSPIPNTDALDPEFDLTF